MSRIRPRKVRVAFGEAFMPEESFAADPYSTERLRPVEKMLKKQYFFLTCRRE
jgi:hypothetical protein